MTLPGTSSGFFTTQMYNGHLGAKNVTALWPSKRKNVALQDLDVFSNTIYFKWKYQVLLLKEQRQQDP